MYFGAINRYTDGRAGSFTKMISVNTTRYIVPHQLFNTTTWVNNIGLVYLPEDAPIDNVRVATVKVPSSDTACGLVGKISTVSGYGEWIEIQKLWNNRNIAGYTTDSAPQTISADLYFINRPIAETKTCVAVYGYPDVNDDNICVETTNSQSSCNG